MSKTKNPPADPGPGSPAAPKTTLAVALAVVLGYLMLGTIAGAAMRASLRSAGLLSGTELLWKLILVVALLYVTHIISDKLLASIHTGPVRHRIQIGSFALGLVLVLVTSA